MMPSQHTLIDLAYLIFWPFLDGFHSLNYCIGTLYDIDFVFMFSVGLIFFTQTIKLQKVFAKQFRASTETQIRNCSNYYGNCAKMQQSKLLTKILHLKFALQKSKNVGI
jgi:hypothetical protein